MATKKDLQEAQSFSRRRLLTAFTSGAPGGKELEPGKPLRAVVFGLALTAAVILGGLFYGLVRPGLPDGWENGSLVIVRDTGARYVAIDGTLYPVLNTASARLLVPAEEFRIVTTDAATIDGIAIGPTVGIVGAPDALPVPSALRGTGWTACLVDDGAASFGIARSALSEPAEGAVVVRRGEAVSVVAGARRYEIAPGDVDAVLRAIGLGTAEVLQADPRWLALFEPGPALEPLLIPDAGRDVAAGLDVGMVVHPDGTPEDERYLVTAEGGLAPIGPLAYQLYLLGTGARLGGEVSVSPADIAAMPTTEPVAADWPQRILGGFEGALACALLEHDAQGDPTTRLAAPVASPAVALDEPGVRVQASTGALVRGGGAGGQAQGVVVLIDPTGTSFAIPGADEELVGRLGYAAGDLSRVTDRWLQFLAAGPELTPAAAGSSPTTSQKVVEPVTPTPPAALAPSRPAVDSSGRCEPGVVAFDPATPLPLTQLQAALAGTMSTGSGQLVAVVDSGIDAAHPQLSDAVVGGVNLVPDGADARGYTDDEGHGTAIAGLIAAQPVDGSGVVGLAPDARLLAVRVFRATDERSVEAGFGPNLPRVAQGIRWATAAGADVISVSLSDPLGSPDLAAAVAEAVSAGVVVVASGGNRLTAVDLADGPRYPAAYPGVIAVAAADATGTVTDASIHGPHIDVAAPGAWVSSTATTAGNCLFTSDEPSTSYATGYVSAAVALLRAAHPGEDAATTAWRLTASASRANPDTRDDRAGWGLIQPAAALTIPLDPGLRGPSLDGAAPGVPVVPPEATVAPSTEPPAIRAAREAAITAAAVAVALVAALAVWAPLRRRRDPSFDPEPADSPDDASRDAATREDLPVPVP